MIKFAALTFFLFVCYAPLWGQIGSVSNHIRVNDSLNSFEGKEKIFVHSDRAIYEQNDTLWFKGYIVSGAFQEISDSSKIAYIELVDNGGEIISKMSAYCYGGIFHGNVALKEPVFAQGSYILRAYTNRMRNFGDSLIFTTTIKVLNRKLNSWTVNFKELYFTQNQLSATGILNRKNKEEHSAAEIQIDVLDKNKTIARRKLATDDEGNFTIDVPLKISKTPNLLQLKIVGDNLDFQVPVSNKSLLTDMQFFPEGGTFIAGKRQRLGFKALDALGIGKNVSGVIKNSKGEVIESFSSIHKGMGMVWLTPELHQTYSAVLSNGETYSLPPTQDHGSTLQVGYNNSRDTLLIKTDLDSSQQKNAFIIAGSTRGKYFLTGKFFQKSSYEVKLPVNTLPTGVARFTLFNEIGMPLNERAIFINRNDALQITVSPHKLSYRERDSVSLSISAKNEEGAFVSGNFSLAVLDTSQVAHLPDMENIVSYMNLTSDLKGSIEDPFYYLRNPMSDATDALMLTQGWVRYEFANIPYTNNYEKEFSISGKVTNMLNKGIGAARVSLIGKDGLKRMFYADTTTNKDGVFHFNDFPVFFTDSVSLIIKGENRSQKSFGMEVKLNEKKFPLTTTSAFTYINNGLTFDTAVQQHIARRELFTQQLKLDRRYLEEVVVTAKLRIPRSRNLNRDGGADITIRETELERKPKETLLDLLKRKIPDFQVERVGPAFYIRNRRVKFLMDGILLSDFIPDFNGMWNLLNYYNAEDVRGVEVMYTPRYSTIYRDAFVTAKLMYDDVSGGNFAYIEITTHGGIGPLKQLPGMYWLKPDAPFVSKQFYSPKYTSPSYKTVVPDLRKTVYWNPDINTNEKGEANVSFYTSESKGSYMVIIQGTDFLGGFGVQTIPVKVESTSKDL